jgi:protocatechuate 3,4-dioxygenase beta subunit
VLNDGLHLLGQPRDELVVVLGTNPGTLEGRVVDVRQQPVAAATVVLIPDGGIRFRVDHKFTSTDASGRFQMQSIPPGDYKVFAWEEVERGDWQDPDFVRDYESLGKPVRIEEGGKHVNFEVAVIPPKP